MKKFEVKEKFPEEDVKTIYNVGEESHIRHFRDTLDFVLLFLRNVI